MKINDKDIKKLNKTYRGKLIRLTSGKYYCKYNLSDNNFSSLSYAVNELIAYYVLKDLKIISPKYYIVLIDENRKIYSLVSKAINDQGKFYKASDLGIKSVDGVSLYSLWFYLNDHFIKDPHLYIDIIKMYLFDLFFLNVDRHVNNFGFIINKGHYSLGLLDNEEILLYDNLVPLINATYEKEKWYQELKHIQNNDHNKKVDLEMVIRNRNPKETTNRKKSSASTV